MAIQDDARSISGAAVCDAPIGQQWRTTLDNSIVKGTFHTQFAPVAEAFLGNFTSQSELGASVCVTHHGKTILNLWGGHKDAGRTQPWQEDTLCLIFSNTKALVGICIHILVDQGVISLDDKVAKIWPEFAANGKGDITIAMLLNHSSGVVAFRDRIEPGANVDWDYMVGRLANERPFWKPGEKVGYQMITHGWLLGEIVRRTTGLSLGAFIAQYIAKPHKLNLYLGLPSDQLGRVAPVKMSIPNVDGPLYKPVRNFLGGADSIPSLALFNNGITDPNSVDQLSAELGAHGAVANAASMCRLFCLLEQELSSGGSGMMSRGRVEDLSSISRATDNDLSFLIPMRFSLGFMLRMDNRKVTKQNASSFIIGPRAFGHAGWGGSFVFADPDHGIAMSYVPNRLRGGRLVNNRGQALIYAAYKSLQTLQEPDLYVD